jgi:hypothetical protein
MDMALRYGESFKYIMVIVLVFKENKEVNLDGFKV